MILTPKFQFNLSYFPPFQRVFFKKTPRRRHTRSVVISKRVWTCYKSIHVLEVYRHVAPFFNKYGIVMVFWNEIDNKRIILLLFLVFFYLQLFVEIVSFHEAYMYVSCDKIKTCYCCFNLSHYTAIDWFWGLQQFCLTQGRICCSKP